MLPRAHVLALLPLLLGVSGITFGHHPLPSQLRDALLCLDSSSIVVAIQDPFGTSDAAVTSIQEPVREAIARTLTTLRVDWQEANECRASQDRVHVTIDARYLSPEIYRNFPESTYSLVVTLAIDPAHGSDRSFVHGVSELFSATQGSPSIFSHVVRRTEESSLALALAWWEGNPASRTKQFWLDPAIGAGFAVGVALRLHTMLRAGHLRRE